jgi:hypothetical protein
MGAIKEFDSCGRRQFTQEADGNRIADDIQQAPRASLPTYVTSSTILSDPPYRRRR